MTLTTNLTTKQTQYLKRLAHKLKPVVMLGDAGLSEGVVNETIGRLAHHELIKVRISGMDRQQRFATAQSLAARTDSQLVNTIGNIAILYKAGKRPVIRFPE